MRRKVRKNRAAQKQQLAAWEKASMSSQRKMQQHLQGIESAFKEAEAAIGLETECDPISVSAAQHRERALSHRHLGGGARAVRKYREANTTGSFDMRAGLRSDTTIARRAETQQRRLNKRRQTRRQESELAATDELVQSALDAEAPSLAALDDFTSEQNSLWDNFQYRMRANLHEMEHSLHTHRERIERHRADNHARISEFREQLRTSAGAEDDDDAMRSLKLISSEVGRLAQNAADALSSSPGPLQDGARQLPSRSSSTQKPKLREDPIAVDTVMDFSSAFKLQEYPNVDDTDLDWTSTFKAVKAGKVRREKQLAANKAIADAYFSPKVHDSPFIDSPFIPAKIEFGQERIKPRQVVKKKPKQALVKKKPKQEMGVSDIATLLKETVKATVSAMAPAVTSPAPAAGSSSSAVLEKTTKLLLQTMQQNQKQQQEFFAELLTQHKRQQPH